MEFFINIFLLTGTIIGAGIFSLPAILSHTGVYFYLLLAGLAFISAYLGIKYRFLINKTKADDQMPAYLSKALGKKWGTTSLILFTLSLIGALTSYLLLIQEQLGSVYLFLGLTWSILILDLKQIKKFDSILTICLMLLVIMLIVSSKNINLNIVGTTTSIKYLIKAFGVILFSLTGFSVIPELSKSGKPNLSIKTTYFLVSIIYIIFASTVNTEDKNLILDSVVFFAVITSYIPMSFVLEEVFIKDLKIQKTPAKLTTLILPVIIAFYGIKDFITALSITGGVFIALLQILIISAYLKLKKKLLISEKIILYLSIGVFAIASLAEIILYFI
ncbi:MAG: hypothetical protein KatS3mg090_0348 [Patescibacteria group bacterium]|nr:MAG: hypothetical protein KatS3mg090_0348 [Patescibacteria group bacterium]